MVEGERTGDLANITSPISIFGNQPGNNITGKSVSILPAGTASQIPNCPNCGSAKTWRAGLRYLKDDVIQRWVCRKCGFRFSENPLQKKLSLSLNNGLTLLFNRQICVEETKNLTSATELKTVAGDRKQPIHHSFERKPVDPEVRALAEVLRSYLSKNGYAKGLLYPENLMKLSRWGADLKDPESVKAVIAKQDIKDGTKLKYAYAYNALMRMWKLHWEMREYKQEEIIPFVPDESELDQLISACYSRRMATYLQTLKETWPDPTEALRIERKDINGNVISINHPVKDHLPREIEVSDELVSMLNSLPNNSHLFFQMKYSSMFTTFNRLRKRLAELTKNPRFLQITPTSFRTWGGTMLAHYSNGNVLLVKKILGHKRIENTMKYIGRIEFKEDRFETAVSTTIDEDRELMSSGFKFVTERSAMKLWQRPKRFGMCNNKRKSPIRNAY